jgi:ubiquinone/menaquinone biosynthesis C-methylase UbiE
MLKPVDYNERQHIGYRAGRAMPAQSRAVWAEAFTRRAPEGRPLSVLDLGSGTGRLTPLLAETFGGPTWGVEPHARMRAQAEANPHPETVAYLEGSAEAIPLADGACDLIVMFLSLHHVADRAAAACEINRVLRPGGRVLIRSTFADRMPVIDWHAWFEGAREAELKMFPTTGEVEAMFAAVGLERLALDVVRELYADSLAEQAERLKTRAISTFEHLDETAIEAGFRKLDEAVARDPGGPVYGDGDLVTFG